MWIFKTYTDNIKEGIKLTFLVFILCIFCRTHTYAQRPSEQKLDALNEYVDFLNASVHGLSIAQVILVNYNKVINQYVDINSHELTQISNKDLPANIFGGTDAYLSFYDQTNTPESLYASSREKSGVLSDDIAVQLNQSADRIINILRDINQIRFDVETYIQNHDLNEREAIYGVYEYLERGVKLFKDYAVHHHAMSQILDQNGRDASNSLLKTMTNIHRTTKIILTSLRREEEENAERNVRQLNISLNNFRDQVKGNRMSSPQWKTNTDDILLKVGSIVNKMQTFITTAAVPIEDEAYGKFYHYHNYILRYINWYGPGYVRSMNGLIRDLQIPSVFYDEEPIIYKVLYPMKMDEISPIGSGKAVGSIPSTFQSRNVVFKNKTISADSNYLELELFDHQLLDRDTVSVSFNGEWVLQNFELSETPEKLILPLKEDQENYLILHANNLGLIAPNTMAISYRYHGKRQRVYLESNLNESEVVQIVIDGEPGPLPAVKQ